MSSDFYDLMAEGFDAVLSQAAVPITGPNNVTKDCVASPMMKSKALRDSGLMPEIESTIEMTRTDAIAIGILDDAGEAVDRAEVRMGTGVFLSVLVEDDPSDPAIRAHLKRYRGR